MCAAIACPPIRELYGYNPSFKVEVCLHLPLWPVSEVLYEVMSLCGQLELLCAREINQANKDKRRSSKPSENFCNKAQIIIEQLQALSPRLPNNNLMQYLKSTGLMKLYARTGQYLTKPGVIPSNVTWSPMEDHVEALAAMQRLHGLATQIQYDVISQSNHKYIAHQLSLLHQALSALTQVSYMSDLKQSIESNFAVIKQCIGELQDQGKTPQLPEEHRQWLRNLTSTVLHLCANPPQEIQQCLYPATEVLSQAIKEALS